MGMPTGFVMVACLPNTCVCPTASSPKLKHLSPLLPRILVEKNWVVAFSRPVIKDAVLYVVHDPGLRRKFGQFFLQIHQHSKAKYQSGNHTKKMRSSGDLFFFSKSMRSEKIDLKIFARVLFRCINVGWGGPATKKN